MSCGEGEGVEALDLRVRMGGGGVPPTQSVKSQAGVVLGVPCACTETPQRNQL